MIPNFYDENDLTVVLVLVMMSTCTFSWYDMGEAMQLSREFLCTAIRMCEGMDQRNSEVLQTTSFSQSSALTFLSLSFALKRFITWASMCVLGSNVDD